jgi:hypothetical protein
MVTDGRMQEPTRDLARALAIVFGIIAVVVSALLVFAVITLLSRHPFYTVAPPSVSPSTSNPLTGSTPGPPSTSGPNPGATPLAGPRAHGGTAASRRYPHGEPPGDIEDDNPPVTSGPAPLVSGPVPPARQLPSIPALPTPSALP